MRFFERHRRTAPGGGVPGFWAWWSDGGADAVERALADGDSASVARLLGPQVEAVAPGLAWEVGAAAPGVHLLVVTAAGEPELRAPARRWLTAAPFVQTWAFTDTRPALPDPRGATLDLGPLTLTVGDAVVSARVAGFEVDVSVHHPTFADLDEPSRDQATFLLLDSVLGEDVALTWLGAVTSSTVPPLDPVPLTGLLAVVDELRSRATAADGGPVWAMLSGRTPEGRPIQAAAAQPLRSVVAPELDTYVGVVLPFSDRTEDGLPGPNAQVDLRAFESGLAELGPRGRPVAHQTGDGIRLLHVYVDGTTDGAAVVRSAAARWRGGGPAQVTSEHDPGWAAVHHLRG